MHLRCASQTFVPIMHLLLMTSIAFQLTNSEEKQRISDYEYFPIASSQLDRIKEENIDQNHWHTSSSNTKIGNGHDFPRKANIELDQNDERFNSDLSKFPRDEAVDHVISADVIANIDTEDLEKFSLHYKDSENESNNNDNENDNNNSDNESTGLRSRNNRNRLTHNTELLERLIDLYKLKSSNALAKRGDGPQLSIVNPLDVLRQRLLLELARRRMKENQEQINANAEILKKIGKRSIPESFYQFNKHFTINNSFANNSHLANNKYNTFLTSNKTKSLNKSQKVRRKRKAEIILG